MVDRNNLPEGLLSDIKNSLNITWSDPATDSNVSNWIASGMAYINGKYGEEADYTVDGAPRTMLFEYCRYTRDSALDVFENNFQSMLLGMQNERLVSAYAVEEPVQTPGG